jgi:alpha-soluble NSF attachment protein
VAELYKGDAGDAAKARDAYERAAGWYAQEGAAELDMVGDFKGALERWEQVAAMALESNLTRYSVKDYYLAAGGCYLAIPVSVPRSVGVGRG